MGWTNIAQQSPSPTHERGMSIYNSITWSSILLSQCTVFAWGQPLSTCLIHSCLCESSLTYLHFIQPYPLTTRTPICFSMIFFFQEVVLTHRFHFSKRNPSHLAQLSINCQYLHKTQLPENFVVSFHQLLTCTQNKDIQQRDNALQQTSQPRVSNPPALLLLMLNQLLCRYVTCTIISWQLINFFFLISRLLQ